MHQRYRRDEDHSCEECDEWLALSEYIVRFAALAASDPPHGATVHLATVTPIRREDR
jgi:hypothetical protein